MPDSFWILALVVLAVVSGVMLFRDPQIRDRSVPLASASARVRLLTMVLMGSLTILTKTGAHWILYGEIRWLLALSSGIVFTIVWAVMWFVVAPRWLGVRPDKRINPET
jgi:hypothetical protein